MESSGKEKDNIKDNKNKNNKDNSNKCGKDVGSWSHGECCSKQGLCGKSDDYCLEENGCQSEFGKCKSNNKNKNKNKNNDGKYGKGIGPCPEDECCSKQGRCGTTEKYCTVKKGCQSEFLEDVGILQTHQKMSLSLNLNLNLNWTWTWTWTWNYSRYSRKWAWTWTWNYSRYSRKQAWAWSYFKETSNGFQKEGGGGGERLPLLTKLKVPWNDDRGKSIWDRFNHLYPKNSHSTNGDVTSDSYY